jgi:predicted RNase H-like HicB family nuclease
LLKSCYNKYMKYKNTLEKGSVRYIIFKEDGVWYGVALEFNIVEEGDSPEEVMSSLFQAIKDYVKTASKFKIRPMPLNQKPDKEYQELWNKLENGKNKEEVYTFGFTPFKNYAPVC